MSHKVCGSCVNLWIYRRYGKASQLTIMGGGGMACKYVDMRWPDQTSTSVFYIVGLLTRLYHYIPSFVAEVDKIQLYAYVSC